MRSYIDTVILMFCLRPGKDGNLNDCCKPCPPRKQIIFKTCPRDPYIQDTSCRQNTSIGGMLRRTTYKDNCCNTRCAFTIETFAGDCIVPINLDKFCINETGDDQDLINVLYEGVQDHYCSSFGQPVSVLKINRLWKGEVRTAVGTVRRSPTNDSNGVPYYQIVDSRELEGSGVYFIPVHTMGVSDDNAYMEGLIGQTVSITYVDFGKEKPDYRCGIPITIIKLEVV